MQFSSNHLPNIIPTDFLVIGSGLAGLLLTLKLAEAGASVVLASKETLSDSNSSYAQGGIAASLPANRFDSPDLHLEDTLKSGCGLVDPRAAHEIIFSGHLLISELSRFGVSFDLEQNGALSLSREGGHSRPRVVHDKDATGRSITSSLIQKLKELRVNHKVTVLEHAFTQTLLLEDGVCVGARVEKNNRTISVLASQTVLATGGLGQLYSRTTNPAIATGDGVALAYRAGAALIDMEFVQFHPTVLAVDNAPPFLISEAVRGAGATLQDSHGVRFMSRFHEDLELATRDVVARAIQSVMQNQASTAVFLDLTGIGDKTLLSHFPNIVNTVRQFGIDVLNQPIPVSPAAHYFMGGILTDLNGSTTLSGLSAIGECASIGLHGANRLASNSLLEAGTMALKATDFLLKTKSRSRRPSIGSLNHFEFALPPVMSESLAALKNKMYSNVGLIRNDTSLKHTLDFLCATRSPSAPSTRQELEASNLHLLAGLITNAALLRKESRGAHYRQDHQLTNDRLYAKRLVICQENYSWVPKEKGSPPKAKPLGKELVTASNS